MADPLRSNLARVGPVLAKLSRSPYAGQGQLSGTSQGCLHVARRALQPEAQAARLHVGLRRPIDTAVASRRWAATDGFHRVGVWHSQRLDGPAANEACF